MTKGAPKAVEDGSLIEPRHNDPLTPLSIRGMTVTYGRKPVVYDVDFAAPAGRMIAII